MPSFETVSIVTRFGEISPRLQKIVVRNFSKSYLVFWEILMPLGNFPLF